jgi:two-component system response regulator HupR/HoxA
MEKERVLFVDGRTVLFVDDDAKVLASLKRGLIEEPYNTIFANSGKEALDILKQQEVNVIVTDMRMPEMNGLELLKVVKEDYPHIIRMILSGYTDIDTLLKAINEGEIFRFIPKPWKSNEELKTIVRQAIEFYELHGEREMLIQFFEMWIEGMEAESVNIQFLQELVATRRKHLYEWKQKSCSSVPNSR